MNAKSSTTVQKTAKMPAADYYAKAQAASNLNTRPGTPCDVLLEKAVPVVMTAGSNRPVGQS